MFNRYNEKFNKNNKKYDLNKYLQTKKCNMVLKLL